MKTLITALLLCVATPALAAGTIEGTLEGPARVAKDAVVYLTDAPRAPSAGTATYDQKGMVFIPRVLPVVRGTTVKFLNSDTVRHNVFSPDREKYNLGTWPTGETRDRVFDQCDEPLCAYVQLCNVHPEMEGYIVVLQSPQFAKVGKDGSFRIEGVPAGTWTLAVWSPKKAKAAPVKVTVEDGKAATAALKLQ